LSPLVEGRDPEKGHPAQQSGSKRSGASAEGGVMRKRRALIIDDEISVLKSLAMFFEERGYEVIASSRPVRCPVYNDCAWCDTQEPCSDILITDHQMPGMTGVELLRAQSKMGCRLPARNKAIMTGSADESAAEVARELGCLYLRKPFSFDALEPWLRECEALMDLNRHLGLKRREPRNAHRSSLSFRQAAADRVWRATLVNISRSGLCLKACTAPTLHQVLHLIDDLPTASKKFRVQWSKDAGDGEYLVGLSCC